MCHGAGSSTACNPVFNYNLTTPLLELAYQCMWDVRLHDQRVAMTTTASHTAGEDGGVVAARADAHIVVAPHCSVHRAFERGIGEAAPFLRPLRCPAVAQGLG